MDIDCIKPEDMLNITYRVVQRKIPSYFHEDHWDGETYGYLISSNGALDAVGNYVKSGDIVKLIKKCSLTSQEDVGKLFKVDCIESLDYDGELTIYMEGGDDALWALPFTVVKV